jgi:integrase
MSTEAPQIVQVDFNSRGLLKAVSPGVYQYERQDEGFYCRPVIDGRQRIYKLKSLTKRAAEIEWGKVRAELAQYHAGLAKNPFITSEAKTIKDLSQFYLTKGCPGKNPNKTRAGTALREETFRVNMITQWRGANEPADQMTAEKWRAYRDWRIKHVKRWSKGGDRAVDKEKNTLSNIFRCAIRHQSQTGITANPMAHEIERFRSADKVEHCRDHMPRSGDELHAIARALFQESRSQVLAWQMLLEAMVGQRSSHTLQLRWDAQDKTKPGYISGGKLYLFRSTSSKGTYGHIEIHSALAQLLDALKAWRDKKHPESPWYFPSPADPTKPVAPASLTHRLANITKVLDLPKRTSHGMRSYYVNVRRSMGWSDEKIALHIGHTTRGKLIVEVYGEGLDYKLDWLPSNGIPAWGTPEPRPIQLDLL